MAKLTKKYLKENASEFVDAMVDGAYDKMADLYNGAASRRM